MISNDVKNQVAKEAITPYKNQIYVDFYLFLIDNTSLFGLG